MGSRFLLLSVMSLTIVAIAAQPPLAQAGTAMPCIGKVTTMVQFDPSLSQLPEGIIEN